MDTTLALNDYIGIPYEFAGHTKDGADCIGLVRLFYRDNKWKPEIYDGSFEHDWYKREPLRMVKWFMRNMRKVRDVHELTYGDVVYFHLNGEGHCGIYLEYGKVLMTFPNGEQWDTSEYPSSSFVSHRDFWGHGFKIGFRRR